jgi:hypothetical protein
MFSLAAVEDPHALETVFGAGLQPYCIVHALLGIDTLDALLGHPL